MLTCPSCGAENPEGARFCNACGAALERHVSTGDERKVVSVLFVDLVGFTARSDEADPEDVRATLRPYHAAVKNEIERFGGTVEKFIGDAVMAVFGAPTAHEDDPEERSEPRSGSSTQSRSSTRSIGWSSRYARQWPPARRSCPCRRVQARARGSPRGTS